MSERSYMCCERLAGLSSPMTPPELANAIANWRPTRHPLDQATATRLAATTRALASAATWANPTNAKLACGHIFRYLIWLEAQADPEPSRRSVEAYLAHLRAVATPKGTFNPTRAALYRCLPDDQARPPTKKPLGAGDTVDAYAPDPTRIAPSLWASIAGPTRSAVSAAHPADPNQANSMLVPTSLYMAWATNNGTEACELFTPASIARFLEIGRAGWPPATHRTYTSQLRRVARASRAAEWPTQNAAPAAAVAICTEADFERVAKSIRGRPARPRRHLTAAALLARGAGITGKTAATIQPPDIQVTRNGTEVVVTSGPTPRNIPVIAELAPALHRVAAQAADSNDLFLLGGRGTAKGAANRMSSLVVEHSQLTGRHIDTQAMRNSWLIWLVQEPLGLAQMLEIAGLRTAGSLDRVLRAGTVDSATGRLAEIAEQL